MAYDLRPVRAPRMGARSLEVLARLLDRPVVGKALARGMLRGAGMSELRRTPPLSPAVTEHRAALDERWSEPEREIDLAQHLGEGLGGPLRSVADFVEAYRSGRCTPVDVAKRFFEAEREAEQSSPPVRAFVSLRRDEVRAAAEAAAARWARGAPKSALDGVPCPIKDEIDQAGHPTTMGTRFFAERPAFEDAGCVARLREAGALLVGKTNMHELGAGPTGHNAHFGTPPNPHHANHYPGGSSSGSAVSVALGLAPIAVGCDAGGSVRLPAAFCGVVGLKPTWGRISKHGVAPFARTVGHVGPLGATTRDVALAYGVLAGRDPRDPATLGQPPVDLEGLEDGDLRGLRIGVFRPWFDDADEEVRAACRRTLAFLEERGATVRPVVIPRLELARVVHLVTLSGEAVDAHVDDHWDAHRTMSSPEVRVAMALARAMGPADHALARRHRADLTGALRAVLDEVDVVVTPTAATTAPRRRAAPDGFAPSDVAMLDRALRFTTLANLTGVPAITFPAGYDRTGLPIGFQAMAAPWRESLLLRLALVGEQAHARRPAVSSVDLLAGLDRPAAQRAA